MRRDTMQGIRQAKADTRTLEERMADAAAAAAEREQTRNEAAGHLITQPGLPSNRTTELVTVTTDELADVLFSALSLVLQRHTSLTKATAHDYAARAAIEGQQIVRANGWVHRGADPRG